MYMMFYCMSRRLYDSSAQMLRQLFDFVQRYLFTLFTQNNGDLSRGSGEVGVALVLVLSQATINVVPRSWSMEEAAFDNEEQ